MKENFAETTRRKHSVIAFLRGLRRECGDERSSEEERRENARAPIAEEGRDKLRKAMGSRKWAEIHGCPNGETRPGESPVIMR